MIILRQKEYATAVERTHVAMNKIPKPSIKDLAKEKSKLQKLEAIGKIKKTLGKEGTGGKYGESVGGFFRGKNVRARLKMGQVSPEAVEKLEKKKIAEVLKDKSLSPEEIEKKMREPLVDKVKSGAKKVGKKIKSGAKSIYEDTSGVAGRVTELGIKHPGVAVGNIATTVAPLPLGAAKYAAIQGVTAGTHAGTVGGSVGEWLVKDIPVRRAVRDPKTGKKVKDAAGKVVKRKPVPFSKIYERWGRKAGKHVEGIFEGKPIKGTAKRIVNKVEESHRASHPYENRIPVSV